MRPQSAPKAQSIEKKQKAGVSFSGTASGKLDESEIPSDGYKSHYMYPSDESKSDSSYPVVDASGDLREGNVTSAWELGCRGRCSDEDKHKSRLKKLSAEFDSDPLADRTRGSIANRERDDRLECTVEFKATDDAEQIAYGAVLVPDRIDHMGDFFRGDVVEDLADGFAGRVEERDAVPGVMHSVFPSHISLAENRLTDEPEELGDRSLPAGSWVQGWQFEDDELWQLVKDGVLGGYSIGGTIGDDWVLHNDGPPDGVEVPEEVEAELDEAGLSPEEILVREIKSGRILEVSAVDFPAVPDATHETYKSLEKGNPALTNSVIDARLYLESRGHSEADAKRLAEYLQSEKSKEPSSWIARAKRYFSRGENHNPDGERAEKGQVLSAENITRTMAIHDIALNLLGTELDHNRSTFASDSSFDFAGVAFTQPEDSGGEGTVFSAHEQAHAQQPAEPAEPGATRTETKTLENMSDDEKHDVIERLESLESKFEEDGTEQTEEKDADADGSEDAAAADERMAALEAKFEQQTETQERMLEVLERMASAQGVSQQADVSGNGNSEVNTWSRSPFAVGGGSQ